MSNNSSSEGELQAVLAAAKLLPEFKAGVAIHRYYMPVMLCAGIIGNVLSLLVMIKKHNRQISCCLYMAYLAANDLCMNLVSVWVWMVSGVLRHFLYWECKVIGWSTQVFNMYGVYLVVAMTIDRYLAICHPHRFHTCRTPRTAHKGSVTMAAVVLLYTMPYLYTADFIGGGMCSAVGKTDLFSQVYSTINTCLGSVIPFSILISLNACIAVAVMGRAKKIKPHVHKHTRTTENHEGNGNSSTTGTSKAKSSAESQLLVMLFLVACALLVLTSPQYIRYIVASTVEYQRSPQTYANFMLLYHVSNKLYFTNHAVNFYLYVLGGSRFRRDVRKLLSCRSNRVGVNASMDATVNPSHTAHVTNA